MNIEINEMMQLQDNINTLAAGADWKKGISNKGKVINWNTCIFTESAELIESTPWKHWKNIGTEPDWDNIQIEIVDLFHFILSEFLVKHSDNISALAFEIESYFLDGLKKIKLDFKQLNLFTKKLVLASLKSDIEKCSFDVIDIIQPFVQMMNYSGLNFNELYRSYIFKNVLNIFRQNNGYKEGSYIKIWNGKEDNEYLMEIKEANPDISYEEIYSRIEKIYNNFNR